MLSMKKRNLVASLFLFLFCAGYAYTAYQLPTRAIENSTQPSFFPWVIVVFLFVLTLSLLIQSLFYKNTDKVENKKTLGYQISAYASILSISYLIFLPILGFVLANIFLFVGLMILYKEKRLIFILTCSITIPLIIFLIFKKVFSISLPVGILGGLF
uniref:DUF1468 domain-containing protein n=1 Tax=uncultured nuHF2 cluster bacterium HF0130_29D04 TaxID=723587 RepID=E7C3A8_9BACT|nr:hypothetical protein [uncultured nuHF2 cluster bacterium HF0130_29D04]